MTAVSVRMSVRKGSVKITTFYMWRLWSEFSTVLFKFFAGRIGVHNSSLGTAGLIQNTINQEDERECKHLKVQCVKSCHHVFTFSTAAFIFSPSLSWRCRWTTITCEYKLGRLVHLLLCWFISSWHFIWISREQNWVLCMFLYVNKNHSVGRKTK